MDTRFWLIQAFNGLSYGALLFLVGSGLSLIFGVMRIVNLAHGSYFLLGGYVALSVIWTTGSWLVHTYLERADEMMARVRAVPPAPGFDAVLAPGDPEDRSRRSRSASGIPIPDSTWRRLVELASEAGLPAPA